MVDFIFKRTKQSVVNKLIAHEGNNYGRVLVSDSVIVDRGTGSFFFYSTEWYKRTFASNNTLLYLCLR